MEYKQGLDRAGDNTHFPFPIKLEYDSENIYLTPLWIPETSDILVAKDKITKQPINLPDANELGRLWLCLEVADGKNRFYRSSKSNGKKPNQIWRYKRPSRGGKYHLAAAAFEPYFQHYLDIGHQYIFPYIKISFSNNGGERLVKHVAREYSLTKWFIYVRGTYRYGYDSDLKRTGIYSNVVKLEFNL